MCRIASSDGVTTLVATPHFRPGSYDCPDVQDRCAALQRELGKRGISLRVISGADVTVTPEMAYYLRSQPRLTISGLGRFVLAELPHEAVPAGWERFLLDLRKQGTFPILTHPERNRWFLNHPEAIISFVMAGGLVQITAMSVTGENGVEASEYCRFLLRRNLVQVIASDAHSSDLRPPVLSGAVAAASSVVGREGALRLVTDHPRAIIEGRVVDAPPVIVPARKRTWFRRVLDL